MIFDKENLFSDAQAITASAVSTNVIDLGATGTVIYAASALVRDIGPGQPIPIRIQVNQAFNNLTSLAIALQSDDNVGFASATTVETVTINLAQLTLGAVAGTLYYVPKGTSERYIRLNYTVTGTAPTLGQVTAGIVMAHQENP